MPESRPKPKFEYGAKVRVTASVDALMRYNVGCGEPNKFAQRCVCQAIAGQLGYVNEPLWDCLRDSWAYRVWEQLPPTTRNAGVFGGYVFLEADLAWAEPGQTEYL